MIENQGKKSILNPFFFRMLFFPSGEKSRSQAGKGGRLISRKERTPIRRPGKHEDSPAIPILSAECCCNPDNGRKDLKRDRIHKSISMGWNGTRWGFSPMCFSERAYNIINMEMRRKAAGENGWKNTGAPLRDSGRSHLRDESSFCAAFV